MRIVGYAYDADVHCPRCTKQALAKGLLKPDWASPCDEHGLHEAMLDTEGNEVYPLFDISECADEAVCGDCFEPLMD